MDVHIPSPAEIAVMLAQFPVIITLIGGLIFGIAVTQFFKKAYLEWYADAPVMPVSRRRYKLTVRLLSLASTWGFTLGLWHGFLVHNGGDEAVSFGTAFSSPLVYDGVRALIAWKYPQWVRHWGSNGHE